MKIDWAVKIMGHEAWGIGIVDEITSEHSKKKVQGRLMKTETDNQDNRTLDD